jgi:drug/metabolite transporter (DMT)-like permease
MTSYFAALFALLSAVMFGCGDAIEHHVVSELHPDASEHGGIMTRVLRSPRWLLGMALSVGAWGSFAAALALGSLLFVQPLVATGVLVALAMSSRLTHTQLSRRGWLMAVLLCTALSVFLVEAAPDGGRSIAPLRSWIPIGGPFLLITIGGVLASRWTRGHLRAAILAVSAGSTLGITGALSKSLVDELGHGVPYAAEHWEPYALALLSFLSIAIIQNAFDSGSLAASIPAVQITEPLVACFLAVALLHEHINGKTTTANILIGISVAAMIIAVVELARLTAHTPDRNAWVAETSRPEPTIDLAGIERSETEPAPSRVRP